MKVEEKAEEKSPETFRSKDGRRVSPHDFSLLFIFASTRQKYAVKKEVDSHQNGFMNYINLTIQLNPTITVKEIRLRCKLFPDFEQLFFSILTITEIRYQQIDLIGPQKSVNTRDNCIIEFLTPFTSNQTKMRKWLRYGSLMIHPRKIPCAHAPNQYTTNSVGQYPTQLLAYRPFDFVSLCD